MYDKSKVGAVMEKIFRLKDDNLKKETLWLLTNLVSWGDPDIISFFVESEKFMSTLIKQLMCSSNDLV